MSNVVLYDYLTNERLLDHVDSKTERICLGRHGRKSVWTQDAINQEMVKRAQDGQVVVRLKSGDPSIFGRFVDEVGVLKHHGIPFEVVPGVSAAMAAGSCVGIPLTHRELASAVTFVTGQENPAKKTPSVDYRVLAKFPGTIVMYMGVTTANRWAPALIEGGLNGGTPVALIRRCSFPDQLVVRCRLDEVVNQLTPRSKLPPPLIAVVGAVAGVDQQLDWFASRPLVGQSVLLTRPSHQCQALVDQFTTLGAGIFVQPAIEIAAPEDWLTVDTVIRSVNDYDWFVFASANGVTYFLDRMFELGLDTRHLGGARLAAMGTGSARMLAEYSLRPDLLPDEYRAESMAAALRTEAALGKRFLVVRASRGRDVLAPALEAAGGSVRQVVAYQSRNATTVDARVESALASEEITWTTVTSSAIARSLVTMFGENLHKTKLASISPITSATLRELGLEPAVEAQEHSIDGLVKAICDGASH